MEEIRENKTHNAEETISLLEETGIAIISVANSNENETIRWKDSIKQV